MKETALYLNTPEPTPSLYGESSQLHAIKPTTSEVIGAYAKEVFIGEGSLSQDIEAQNIRKQERRGTAVSEQDWKSSKSYREGLTWHEGITSESAETLARIHDDRQERAIVMERASGLQSGFGIAGGFAAGIFEPKNFASGIAAALITGGAGMAIPSLGRMIATNTVRGTAVRGALEGGLAAAAVEPSNIESSKIVQGDYTMADSLMNFGLSVVLGAGIGAGAKKLELKHAAEMAAEVPRAYKPETPEIGIKEFDTALAQMAEGQNVDVSVVKQLDNADKARKAQKDLPVLNKKIDELSQQANITRVIDTEEFKKRFEGSQVVDVDNKPLVIYHGTGKDFTAFAVPTEGKTAQTGVFFSDNPAVAATYATGAEGNKIIPSYAIIKNPYKVDAQGKHWSALKEITGFDTTDQLARWARNEGYDGLVVSNLVDRGPAGRYSTPEANVPSTMYSVFDPAQIESIFAKVDANQQFIINKIEDLHVQKGQLESNTRLSVDQQAVKKFQDKIGNQANSSIYDDIKTDDILKDFKDSTIEDEIAFERNLEAMQEEIQDLYDQGLLNDSEIATLERLAEIDEDSAIFDNVLLNAKNCLLR